MKLVMTLLVRDEADVVATNLDYHFAQGVDLAIVTDNASVDGTGDILREFEATGRVRVLMEHGDDFSAWRWRTRMSRLAASEGADWVIPIDADEFWWPRDGSLRSTFERYPADVGVVIARAWNFAPRPVDDRAFFERMTLRQVEAKNLLGKTHHGKAAHRGSRAAKVDQGSSKVRGVPGGRLADGSVEVFHFPWRSYDQFEWKVVTGGRAYRRNTKLGPSTGRVRRWLYDVWEEGRLPGLYAEQLVEGEEVPEGLVEDRRLCDFLRSMPGSRAGRG